MPELVNQATGNPSRKVMAGAASAAVTAVPAAVLVSMLARWFDLDVTPEEAIVVGSVAGSFLTAIASFVGGYITREWAQPRPGPVAVVVENLPSEPVPTAPQQMVNVATPRFGPPTTSGDG